MIWVIAWLMFAILGSAVAKSKNRPQTQWFFICLITGVFGFLAIIGMPKLDASAAPGAVRSRMKKCPKCAEEVKDEALICRFCRHEFRDPVEEGRRAMGWTRSADTTKATSSLQDGPGDRSIGNGAPSVMETFNSGLQSEPSGGLFVRGADGKLTPWQKARAGIYLIIIGGFLLLIAFAYVKGAFSRISG